MACTVRLQVMDKHIGILCKQHLETKFVKVSQVAVRSQLATHRCSGSGIFTSLACFTLCTSASYTYVLWQ